MVDTAFSEVSGLQLCGRGAPIKLIKYVQSLGAAPSIAFPLTSQSGLGAGLPLSMVATGTAALPANVACPEGISSRSIAVYSRVASRILSLW